VTLTALDCIVLAGLILASMAAMFALGVYRGIRDEREQNATALWRFLEEQEKLHGHSHLRCRFARQLAEGEHRK
jgi:hypothetical protein